MWQRGRLTSGISRLHQVRCLQETLEKVDNMKLTFYLYPQWKAVTSVGE